MNSPQPSSAGVKSASQLALSKTVAAAPVSKTAPARVDPAVPTAARQRGYGLPCSKCRTYYSSELPSCPVCKNGERVAPAVTPIRGDAPADLHPELAALEEEREKFLKEFKSQIYSSQMQISSAESLRCSLEHNHQGSVEPAAVCQGCYDHLKGQVDLMEAALRMNVKDATQIVYEAVWADPSDPGKTYQRAAEALLAELRKRAGIRNVIVPLKPKAH